jgi:hypothetical protein
MPTNEKQLELDIKKMLLKDRINKQHSQGTAKDVDVFGRNKEQVERIFLHHRGPKGMVVKK